MLVTAKQSFPAPSQWYCQSPSGHVRRIMGHYHIKAENILHPAKKRGINLYCFTAGLENISLFIWFMYIIFLAFICPPYITMSLVFPSNSKSWRSGFSENSTRRAVLWALLSVPECSLHRRSVCSVQFHQLNHHLSSALQCGIPGWLSALCQARRVDCSLPKWWIPAYIWFWKII